MLDTVRLRVGYSGYWVYSRATLKFQAQVTLNLKKKILPFLSSKFWLGFLFHVCFRVTIFCTKSVSGEQWVK